MTTSTPSCLGPQDFRDMPWKNGGGTTRELLRLPHPARPDDFALRLSIATVAQGGPFSAFPGIDRTLMLLEGEGMALAFGRGRRETLDQPLAPIDFRGEDAVDCRLLGGPLRDLNVMVARDWGQARTTVLRLEDGHPHTRQGDGSIYVYVHDGALKHGALLAPAGHLLALPPGEHRFVARGPTVAIEVALIHAHAN